VLTRARKILKRFRNIKQSVKISNGDSTDEKKETGGGKKAELAPPEPKKELPHGEHKAVADASAEAKELRERLMRLQAEFENYKKRAARENDALRENASADVLMRLLPVVDDFDAAIAHMDRSPHKEFRHGIELIYVKLLDLLRKEGVQEMKCLGESFDPYKHDALRQADGEEGKVVEVIQKGYAFRGKVLRHAKVAVGKEKEGKDGQQG
jgi:molecular chaperone GrpE